MRTTLRIDDDLMRELKQRSQKEQISLSRLINRIIRLGLESPQHRRRSVRYREKTIRMGKPSVDLRKALALAVSLEDQEVIEKMARRK